MIAVVGIPTAAVGGYALGTFNTWVFMASCCYFAKRSLRKKLIEANQRLDMTCQELLRANQEILRVNLESFKLAKKLSF